MAIVRPVHGQAPDTTVSHARRTWRTQLSCRMAVHVRVRMQIASAPCAVQLLLECFVKFVPACAHTTAPALDTAVIRCTAACPALRYVLLNVRATFGCMCAGCSIQDELFASFEQVLAMADKRGTPYARCVLHCTTLRTAMFMNGLVSSAWQTFHVIRPMRAVLLAALIIMNHHKSS